MEGRKDTYCYQRFFPRAPLASFVKFFYYFHSPCGAQERILPQSLGEITFNLDGGENFVSLPGRDPYFVVPGSLDRMVGVCFEPWGLHGPFGLRVGEWGGGKALLQEVMIDGYWEMMARMMEGRTPEEMIGKLEDYLVSRVVARGNTDIRLGLVQDAVRFIDGRHGQMELPVFYKRYSQSMRWVQMVFEESIGMSPKKYSRLKRFHYAAARLTAGAGGSFSMAAEGVRAKDLERDARPGAHTGAAASSGLTSVALEAGYYDQPHFIHEFRAFSGTHPREFLRESNQLNAINARSWF